LVELMDGRIWVESAVGFGSSFHFHARFGVQENPMPRRMFRAEELKGLRMLVVDDNASSREILSTMARHFGFHADVASDGLEAMAQVAEAEQVGNAYDLVLMDWKMPVMDGVECVRRMRSKEGGQPPSVIMVTAYGRDEALSEAHKQGVELKAVMTKPVTA
ncbi:MAG: response regulator, partial [Magnetococcales bacterium]|nr:response regulator [Magnetococcales bacterium]